MLDVVVPKSLHSCSDRFDWKTHCFLHATAVVLDTKHPTAKDSSVVCTLELCSTILEACGHRLDDWSLQVSGRLETCNDLVAEEAVYHRHCFTNFMTRCRNPKAQTAEAVSRDKTDSEQCIDERKIDDFHKLCTWQERSSDLYSISELHEIMTELAVCDACVYCEKHMQHLLLQKYAGSMRLSQHAGKQNVVCFDHTASKILTEN